MGDAAVRAGQPERRDDGPAAADDVAPAQAASGRPGSWSPPVRALVQRLGPHVEDVEPVIVAAGDQVDPAELVAALVRCRLPPRVPGRAPRRGRGAGLDRRRVPVDRRRARSASTCGATRSTGSPSSRSTTSGPPPTSSRPRSSRAASSCPPTRSASGPAALVAAEPWGREQWERLAEGLVFDGMESWLPWLTEGEHVLLDLSTPTPRSLLVEPRRMRDRAADSSPRRPTSPAPWPRPGARPTAPSFPRLHLPFDRSSPTPTRRRWTVTNVARAPDAPVVEADRVGPGRRRRRRPRQPARPSCWPSGYRVVVAADGAGSGAPPATSCSRRRVARLGDRRSGARPTSRGPAVASSSRRSTAASSCPSVKLAVLAEPDLTGRRRAHRRASAPAAATPTASSTTSSPATTSCTTSTASPATAAWSSAPIGGVERDYLLLEYRGGDKLYVPSDQIDAVRHYTGGESPDAPPPRRQRLAEDQGAGPRPRCARSPRSSSCSTRRGSPRRATRSRPTRRGSASSRRRSRTRRRPTS